VSSAREAAIINAPANKWRAVIVRGVRLALGLLPIVWLVRSVHLSSVLDAAAAIGPLAIGASFVAQFMGLPFAAWRWQLILHAYGADEAAMPPLRTLLRHVMVGQYFAVLPSGVVGDAVRASRVTALFPDPRTPYVLILVERIAGLLGLLALGAFAGLAGSSALQPIVARALAIGFGVATVLAAIAFAMPQLRRRWSDIDSLLARVPVAGNLLASIPLAARYRPLIGAVLLSVPTQACAVLAIAALLVRLDPHATIAVCLKVVPAIILVTHVPLTPAGLGQREIAFVEFFGAARVAASHALAASLLIFAIWLTLSLLGGVVLAYERLSESRSRS
jgi:uncharacterized membrane protein YbhN (UPF0104 family)